MANSFDMAPTMVLDYGSSINRPNAQTNGGAVEPPGAEQNAGNIGRGLQTAPKISRLKMGDKGRGQNL
jgi:hypothetical protein